METLNEICLQGRLTRDGELSYTKTGTAMFKFDLAVTNSEKKGDKWEDHPVYLNGLVLWGKTAENMGNRMTKGVEATIKGKLDMETWTDSESGKARSKLTIKIDRIWTSNASKQQGDQPKTENLTARGVVDKFQADFEDDIPF